MSYGTWLRATTRPTASTLGNHWLRLTEEGRNVKNGPDREGKWKEEDLTESEGERWEPTRNDDKCQVNEYGKNNQRSGSVGMSTSMVGGLPIQGAYQENFHTIMGINSEE